MLEYKKVNKKVADSLLSSLSHLFSELQKKRSNSVKPTKFIQMLKKENEIFDNILQHDAQEFLNYLLNHIGDTLKNDAKAKNSTWVHDLFQVRFGFILCVQRGVRSGSSSSLNYPVVGSNDHRVDAPHFISPACVYIIQVDSG